MAALRTAASSTSGQGIIKVFQFVTVVTGDTFTGPPSPKAFWAQAQKTNGTQASAGCNVSESSGTYTFQPGEDTQSVTLFVLL